jgi:hypothetical protein
MLENMKGQTRMDNPEKLAALGTYDRRRRQTRQKNITLYVLDTTMRTIQAEDKQNKKHSTQYMLNTTMHKTQDADKQNKKHNTICVEHHHTHCPGSIHALQYKMVVLSLFYGSNFPCDHASTFSI